MVDNDSSGADGPSDAREQGIEFGKLKRQLESHEYPCTAQDLLEAYGDAELVLPEGSERLREILGNQHAVDADHEDVRYGSPQEVHQAIFNLVGSDAVGRESYTDRGATHQVEFEDEDRNRKTL